MRILTDPTFDPPGEHPIGQRTLTKTQGAPVEAAAVGDVDLVLLSHDQHPDNLDVLGREYVARARLVLSTAAAQERLGGPVRALRNWERIEVPTRSGQTLQITGVPAQHGPDGTERLVGEVTGFVIGGARVPTVYVSGDNASLSVVQEIARRLGPFDIALLSAGAAQTALVPGGYLTLTSELAVAAARSLGSPAVVPLHFEGWAHFTQGASDLRRAFADAGLVPLLHLLEPGEEIVLSGEPRSR
jgi:L-ascorbate metabolism protein UlaG (beta-lactamase superfamily)